MVHQIKEIWAQSKTRLGESQTKRQVITLLQAGFHLEYFELYPYVRLNSNVTVTFIKLCIPGKSIRKLHKS